MIGNVVISSGRLTLALGLPARGMPEILACGRSGNVPEFWPEVKRAGRINGMDEAVPSAILCPTGGMGFFGWPAIAGHRSGRDFILEFAGWNVQTKGQVTTLSASDRVAKIDIAITIRTNTSGLIAMSTALKNVGNEAYCLDRCMAASFLLGSGQTELTGFTGMWGREFQTRRSRLDQGLWIQESRRGRTSHDRYPMLFVESGSEQLGFHLGWSGNHLIAIDRLDDGRRLLHMGELFEPGEMQLAQGETYVSPVAYTGPDVAAFHDFVRDELITWPGGKMRPRPVTLNTWEGNYFDHRMDSLKAQANEAAAIGIERFVLDDGWFGKRDDDTTSLGDWSIDQRKYPDGLKPLIDHVTGLGMEFGIWYEPEMVNPQSDLFRAHPDWVLQVEGRPLLLSRNQLVLDLSRPEVADYLFAHMSEVLSAHAISYVKWDMNRDLTHAGGQAGRAMTSAQTRAVYELMARVRAAFPDVEIESCASGGGRVDYGVLRHTQRVWTSDCTDAFERLEIQRGASMFLPPELLGAHVSASPNHQTNRLLSMSFRALVAMAYHFGVELNPLTLTAQEREELAHFIDVHKRLRPILHAPGAQFCGEPVDGRYLWGASSPDRIAAFVIQGPLMIGEQPEPLRLPLDGKIEGRWRMAAVHPAKPDFIRISQGQEKLLSGQLSFSAETLTQSGLPLPMLRPESGMLVEFEKVAGE